MALLQQSSVDPDAIYAEIMGGSPKPATRIKPAKMPGVVDSTATASPNSTDPDKIYAEIMGGGSTGGMDPAFTSDLPPAGLPASATIPKGLQPEPPDQGLPLRTTELGSLMFGVDPRTFLNRIGGGIASLTNTALPSGDVRKTTNQLPEPTPDEDVGAKAVAVGTLAEPAVALGKLGVQAGKAGVRAGARALSTPERIAGLESDAAANMARSLKPTTMEGRATTQRIAPELLKEGTIKGKGSTIDKQISKRLNQASDRLEQVEDRLRADVRPENQIAKASILDKIDAAIDRLHVRGPGPLEARATGHSDAVSALQKLRAEVDKLPDYADFDQVISLRRQFDNAIKDAGGFNAAGTAADKTAMRAKRGVADLLRNSLNDLDPEFKIVNKQFSLFRNAQDVVDRRLLGDVGTTGSGLPGRGSILDDILATWAGNAVGGPVGGATVELGNLARQSRWWSSKKGAWQQGLADTMKPTPPTPAGLIGTGQKIITAPETSAVTATQATAAPANRAIRRGLLLNEANPTVTVEGGPTTQRTLRGSGTEAKTKPLPARSTGLNYGRGRGTDELQNFQYTGETTPDVLSRPEGPGVLQTSDPKVIRGQIQSINEAIKEGRLGADEMKQLRAMRTRLVKQLETYGK